MKKFKYWIPSLILMILIFIGSNDPASGEKSDFITKFIWRAFDFITGNRVSSEQETATTFVIRKIAHVTEYLLLTLSYYYAISKIYDVPAGKNKGNVLKTYLIALLLGLFYAISDEYHQTFIPGRVGTYEDVMIDTVGILTVYFLLNLKIFRQK